MSREPSSGPDAGAAADGPVPNDEPPGPAGSQLDLTGPGAVALAIVVGLVGGWLVRRVASYTDATAPLVTWTQSLVLFLCAAILGVTAWHTRRALDGRQLRPAPHRLVNRLVLARACALVGALVAGGYFGYALSWLGAAAELAGQRSVRSLLAGVGGLFVLATALLLERACRVTSGEDRP